MTIPKIWQTKLGNAFRIWWNTTDRINTRWFTKTTERAIADLIEQENPDALYVSLPPFSMSKIAVKLSTRFDLPLIVDMRDAWSQWTVAPWSTRLHYQKVLQEEKRLFETATQIIGVTQELVELFQDTHPTIPTQKFSVIPNGFDYKLELPVKIHSANLKNQEQIRIGYVGSFYFNPQSHKDEQLKWWQKPPHKMIRYAPGKEDWSYRSPLYFLQSLETLLRDHPELKNRIRFEHIGNTPSWLLKALETANLSDIFISHGFVAKQRVMEIKRDFDFFLGTSEKIIDGQHYCLPSKIFDYLKDQKPILAFVTEGAQKDFLLNSGLGIFFDPDQPELASQKLFKLLQDGTIVTPNPAYLNLYQRRLSTKKLAQIITAISPNASIAKISVDGKEG